MAVPGLIPSMIPVKVSIVATAGVELVHVPHVPPIAVSVNVVDAPVHSMLLPVMAGGTAVTVTILVELQPAAVYDMTTVPALMEVTRPVVGTIVAIEGLEQVHTPPGVASANAMVAAMHRSSGPVTTPGAAFTVTFFATPVQPATE